MLWIIVCWIGIITMTFSLQTFIDNPTVEQFDGFRKDYLLSIASHFQIPVSRQVSEIELDGVEGFSPNPDITDRGRAEVSCYLKLWLRPRVGQYCYCSIHFHLFLRVPRRIQG